MCIRDSIDIVKNIANTRMKIAQLLGYKDYAEYTLKKRMGTGDSRRIQLD